MIIIPDVHGRTFWKSAVEGREDQDILFLGDYVDPYTYLEGIAPYSGLVSLLEIIDFKKANMDRVTLLLGNHDLCYISNLLPLSDRYDEENASVIRDTLLANLSLFQIAHHRTIAGISHIFPMPVYFPIGFAITNRSSDHSMPPTLPMYSIPPLHQVGFLNHWGKSHGSVEGLSIMAAVSGPMSRNISIWTLWIIHSVPL